MVTHIVCVSLINIHLGVMRGAFLASYIGGGRRSQHKWLSSYSKARISVLWRIIYRRNSAIFSRHLAPGEMALFRRRKVILCYGMRKCEEDRAACSDALTMLRPMTARLVLCKPAEVILVIVVLMRLLLSLATFRSRPACMKRHHHHLQACVAAPRSWPGANNGIFVECRPSRRAKPARVVGLAVAHCMGMSPGARAAISATT